MYQIPLVTSSSIVTRENFWKAVGIYHSRPHLVNRKLLVADQVLFYKVNFSSEKGNITDVLSCHALTYEIRKLKHVVRENIHEDLLKDLLITYDKNVNLKPCLLDLNENNVFLSVRLILPRTKNAKNCVELVVLDTKNNFVTFFSAFSNENDIKIIPNFTYRIELTRENFMRITVNNFEDADTNSAEWLADNLFSKLYKWSENSEQINIQSLSMVALEKYSILYNKLKLKYGEPLRKIWWEKTGTDPQKFIFEDVAIASYLICIWDRTSTKDCVKFVDCGCGNGLLVHILNQEGYIGYGIDVRKRQIWDLFLETSDLRVEIVSPESRFPDSTWLIGNHSDELTPWLPIIASRNSLKTNYFVLPCCPFDLNGRKYIRTNTSKSQYGDYIDYIKNISELCSFETSVDKLRIPSTKRISLIGVRSNNELNITTINEKIDTFINTKFSNSLNSFTPRSSVEKVRNCTQIGKNVIEKIVGRVVEILLENKNFIDKQDGTKWNKGGTVHLGELSKILHKDDLKKLKNECGGLQTLLRNHRYLFKIDNAVVSLREPYKISETTKYKEKPCWYNKFHLNGCLYNENICGYKHNCL